MFEIKRPPVARRGEKGPLLTYEQYIALEDGKSDYRKWETAPRCQCCNALVRPHKGRSDDSLTNMSRTATGQYDGTGFVHIDKKDFEKCAYSFPNNRRFQHLTRQTYDYEMRNQVSRTLLAPDIRQANSKVLKYFFFKLAGRDMMAPERNDLWETAKKLYNMPALADHPYLLPYLLILTQPSFRRNARNGGQYKLAFVQVGRDDRKGKIRAISRQMLSFVPINSNYYEKFFVPVAIQLSHAYGAAGQETYIPIEHRDDQKTRFELSFEAWQEIVDAKPMKVSQGGEAKVKSPPPIQEKPMKNVLPGQEKLPVEMPLQAAPKKMLTHESRKKSATQQTILELPQPRLV